MGKIWEHNNCIVIYWDGSSTLIALKANKCGSKLHITSVLKQDTDDKNLTPAALQEIYNKIRPTENDLVILSCISAGVVSLDLSLPEMSPSDAREAVSYELPRHIPCDENDICFGSRIIPGNNKQEGRQLVRVTAVRYGLLNDLLTSITGAGIKIDAFISPFAAVDPLLGGCDSIPFYSGKNHFIFTKAQDSPVRNVKLSSAENTKSKITVNFLSQTGFTSDSFTEEINSSPFLYFAPMLVASYVLSDRFTQDKPTMIDLPKEVKPERYRKQKIISITLAAISALLLFSLFARARWEAALRLTKLNNTITRVKQQIAILDEEEKQRQTKTALINDIKNKRKGNPHIASCIAAIASAIPEDVWLVHFMSRYDIIEVRLKNGSRNLPVPNFSNRGLLKLLSSSINSGGSSTILTVKLKYQEQENNDEQ